MTVRQFKPLLLISLLSFTTIAADVINNLSANADSIKEFNRETCKRDYYTPAVKGFDEAITSSFNRDKIIGLEEILNDFHKDLENFSNNANMFNQTSDRQYSKQRDNIKDSLLTSVKRNGQYLKNLVKRYHTQKATGDIETWIKDQMTKELNNNFTERIIKETKRRITSLEIDPKDQNVLTFSIFFGKKFKYNIKERRIISVSLARDSYIAVEENKEIITTVDDIVKFYDNTTYTDLISCLDHYEGNTKEAFEDNSTIVNGRIVYNSQPISINTSQTEDLFPRQEYITPFFNFDSLQK